MYITLVLCLFLPKKTEEWIVYWTYCYIYFVIYQDRSFDILFKLLSNLFSTKNLIFPVITWLSTITCDFLTEITQHDYHAADHMQSSSDTCRISSVSSKLISVSHTDSPRCVQLTTKGLLWQMLPVCCYTKKELHHQPSGGKSSHWLALTDSLNLKLLLKSLSKLNSECLNLSHFKFSDTIIHFELWW